MAALTVSVYALDPVNGPVPPVASVAVTVKLNEPVAVGVPLSVPFEAREIPEGKAPAVTAKV